MFWNKLIAPIDPMNTLLNTLIKKFEKSYVYKYHEMPTKIDNYFKYQIHWYTIWLRVDRPDFVYSYSLSRGEEYIIEVWDRKYNWFFKKIWLIARRDEIKLEAKIEEENKMKDRMADQRSLIKINNWIEELNWIIVQKPSQEFSQVFEDKNRLDEISEEARKIHKKYQTWFNKLF